jgi:hypothetical protein
VFVFAVEGNGAGPSTGSSPPLFVALAIAQEYDRRKKNPRSHLQTDALKTALDKLAAAALKMKGTEILTEDRNSNFLHNSRMLHRVLMSCQQWGLFGCSCRLLDQVFSLSREERVNWLRVNTLGLAPRHGSIDLQFIFVVE